MKITRYSSTGTTSQVAAPVFMQGEVNDQVLAQAIRVYLSNARQGTSKTKTRSEVNRTKKKWFKQKGTGNARHGARTPSIFVGGGVSHGPNGQQNWLRSLPQQLKHQALMSALIAQSEQVIIHDGLEALTGKTKAAAVALQPVIELGRVLVILDQTRPVVLRSLRNIPSILVTTASRVSALEIAQADAVVFMPEAVTVLEQRLMASIQPIVEVKAKVEKAVAVEKKVTPVKVEKAAAPKKAKTAKVVKEAKAK